MAACHPKSVKEMVVSLAMDGIRREEDIGTKSELESDTVFCSLQPNYMYDLIVFFSLISSLLF